MEAIEGYWFISGVCGRTGGRCAGEPGVWLLAQALVRLLQMPSIFFRKSFFVDCTLIVCNGPSDPRSALESTEVEEATLNRCLCFEDIFRI